MDSSDEASGPSPSASDITESRSSRGLDNPAWNPRRYYPSPPLKRKRTVTRDMRQIEETEKAFEMEAAAPYDFTGASSVEPTMNFSYHHTSSFRGTRRRHINKREDVIPSELGKQCYMDFNNPFRPHDDISNLMASATITSASASSSWGTSVGQSSTSTSSWSWETVNSEGATALGQPRVYSDDVEEARKRFRAMRFGSDVESRYTAQSDVHRSLDDIVERTRSSGEQQGQRRGVDRSSPSKRGLLGGNPNFAIQRKSGSTLSAPEKELKKKKLFRPIIIDGSNVAYAYGNNTHFACNGIRICVEHFVNIGCKEIHVVVPSKVMQPGAPVHDGHILHELQKEGRLVLSWSRKISKYKWVSSYDDRLILEIARKKEGVVISNDHFCDLWKENPLWRDTIRHRVVSFCFVPGLRDEIFLPEDPHGRNGPRLKHVLRF